MGDIALKGNKLTKIKVNLTSLETPKYIKNNKRLEKMYKKAWPINILIKHSV